MAYPSRFSLLDSYQSSDEILAAIEQVASDRFDPEDENTECHRIWSEPTEDEIILVERIAWKLAPDNKDKLYWGDTTIRRTIA